MSTPKETKPSASISTGSVIDEVDQLVSKLSSLKSHMDQASDLAEAGAMASMFAHEVNNLMTQVGGRAQLALMHMDQPERAVYALELACHASAQIAQLAELFMSTTVMTIQPGSLRSILDAHQRALSFLPEADFNAYNFAISGDSSLIPNIPTVLLQQVLLNLYLNAIRAVGDSEQRETGQITIHVSTSNANQECSTWNNSDPGRALSGQMIQIIVEDTGVGMSSDQVAGLFVAKDRAGKAQSSAQGHGLGLAICTKLLTSVHGTIRAESIPGTGTKMIIALPIAPENTQSSAA
ncbi:hypothetical protein COB72_10845 [bacterium]|nr:MAG: hypothetical protein COB72_10845 [bacterium]